MKRGWKVVFKTDRELQSLFIPPGQGGVVYTLGEPTVPKPGCGPLCVFTTKKAAMNCMNTRYKRALYPCLYEPWKGEKAVWIADGDYSAIDVTNPNIALAGVVILVPRLRASRPRH